MAIALRDYQERSINELFAWFENGGQGNPLMVLPTGAGKSVILAALIQQILSQWPHQRLGMITHVKELLEQNHSKLVSIWPQAPVGFYSASIGKKESEAQILYAGIQSIYRKALHVGWFDLLFIDECHLVPKKGNGQYRKFIDDVRIINPNVRIIGLTATAFRLDSGYLHKGEGAIFDDIAAEVTIRELLDKGYLSSIVSRPTHVDLNLANVKKRGGEFIARDVEKALLDQDHIEKALKNAITVASNRKRWLVFCPTVKTSEQAALFLNKSGIESAVVSGSTPKAEREELIEAFKAGRIHALCNCEVLTTGFDAPEIDCIVLLRPTGSTALYIQMLGRGMRIAPGKENCLVLDYAGNIERHGCVDDPNVNIPKGEGDGVAPTKICDNCEAYNHAAARVCVECGEEFPPPETKEIDHQHSTGALLTSQIEPEIKQVADWKFSVHRKRDKPDSLRVEYMSGGLLSFPVATEWACFEHTGYAQRRAASWWLNHGGNLPVPETVSDAIGRKEELTMPSAVGTMPDGKYTKITKRFFKSESENAA